MDKDIVELRVVRPDTGSEIRVRATLAHFEAHACCLIVAWPTPTKERTFEADDFYECLRSFRRIIEADGYRVLCQGARPNVHPSPMGRDGGGMKAYALTADEPGRLENLVSVFAPVDDITPVGTVEDQDAFMRWHVELLRARAAH